MVAVGWAVEWESGMSLGLRARREDVVCLLTVSQTAVCTSLCSNVCGVCDRAMIGVVAGQSFCQMGSTESGMLLGTTGRDWLAATTAAVEFEMPTAHNAATTQCPTSKALHLLPSLVLNSLCPPQQLNTSQTFLSTTWHPAHHPSKSNAPHHPSYPVPRNPFMIEIWRDRPVS